MKAKFTLICRLEGGKFHVVQFRKGIPQAPDGAGSYYARFTENGKRQWKALGNELAGAVTAIRNMELVREYKLRDLPIPQTVAATPDVLNLQQMADKYSDEIKNNKARKTWQAYSNSINFFLASTKKTQLAEIAREDLLSFKGFLRSKKQSGRTIYNNFLNVMVFFKWCDVKLGVKKEDWPKMVEREPEEYSEEEITKLLNAADQEDRLVLNCFLCSGLRSGELAHLTYGDIDFKHSVWTVRPKDDWNTKTEQSQRDVPVPEWLTAKLQQRMEKGRGKANLVFFNRDGGADLHMLRIVKRVAKAAGLTDIRVDDHKFRSTAITRWLREGNSVQDVMRWVGHKDLNTILRYAAKINVRNSETLKKASSAFAQFAAVGD